jgi:hypothetical protein
MVQMIGSAIQQYQPPAPPGNGSMSAGANAVSNYSNPGLMSAVTAFLGAGSGAGGGGGGNGTAIDIMNAQAGASGANRSLGEARQFVGAAGMANRALGANGSQSFGNIVGGAGNVLGVVGGIERGGVMGYGSAAVNAGALANRFGAGIPYLGPAAAALSTYQAVKNWKSGSTKSDAIQGAEAGAAWGSPVGPKGAVVGALIGGAVGAVSSALGGGTSSVEALTAQAYTATFDKATPAQQRQLAMSASPSQNVQYLQGLMNAHDSSPGHESDLQAAFGKNNVNGFTTQMTSTVNAAIKSGKISRNSTPQQIFASVVQPWLSSKAGGAKSGSDIKGNSIASAEQASIMGILSQWQDGAFTSKSRVGVKGQSINIPNYGE